MVYADYDFYATVYGGTALSEDQYRFYAQKASTYIDYITLNRARSVSGEKLEAVKHCACALAELEQDAATLDGVVYSADRPVSSETVGGWSRSYGAKALSQVDVQRTESRRQEIVLSYLAPPGLLRARGYGACPCSPTL